MQTAQDPTRTEVEVATVTTRPFYVDCDTGIDDALALAYLVASPSVDLRGVGTVSGNVDAEVAARNCLDLLSLMNCSHVPVGIGARHPLIGRFSGGFPPAHGTNGVGDVRLPRSPVEPVAESAATMLIRLAREHPGQLSVLTMGPLTNLAQALRREPALPRLVGSLTVMGGAALVPGNLSPVAEANIYNDPEAAAEVFGAEWNLTLVPLDVTMTNLLEEGQRERLGAIDHPVMPLLADMLSYYFDFHVDVYGRRVAAMHDPLAAAVAVGGVELGLSPATAVEVDITDGPGRGQTICDLRSRYQGYRPSSGKNCLVALEILGEVTPHILATLTQLAPTPRAAPPPRLTVVGSINIDLIAACDQLPSAGETVGGATLQRQPGGKGANQAVAAARLVGGSRMIGAVGDDPDGAVVLGALSAAGVDVDGIRCVPGATGTALIAVDRTGENQIVVCTGANAEVALDDVTFDPCEAVLCQLEIDLAVVLDVARRHTGFFALNAAPAMPLPAHLIERCDLIIVNEIEYARMPELATAGLVAVTYGAEGSAIYRTGRKVASAPGVDVPVVSTVGAGDAFCAALVLALNAGLDDETALTIANAVGAHAVGDPSGQPALASLECYS